LELPFKAGDDLPPRSSERFDEVAREPDCPDLLTVSFLFAAFGLETDLSDRVTELPPLLPEFLTDEGFTLDFIASVLFDRLLAIDRDLSVFLSPVELVPDLPEYSTDDGFTLDFTASVLFDRLLLIDPDLSVFLSPVEFFPDLSE
jgi:hypothetical protein